MNQIQNADQSGPSAKKMKSNDEDNNPAAVNGEQQLADIFKLNIDCFEEVFDYLSLKDLTAMGQTCKRMQRIAGHCFQLNYGAAEAEFYSCLDSYCFYLNSIKIDCFIDFLQNVYLNNDAENHMMKFVAALKNSTSIKRIKIVDLLGRLTMAVSTEMKEILSKAESLILNGCRYKKENENVLGELIAVCSSNIKYLSLDRQPNEDQWTHRIYPALEHFELKRSISKEIPALKTLFELNTTIKKFSVDMELFWSNRELFKKSNIKFDTLEITNDGNVEFHLFCRLLNELYSSGFYKKLHIHFHYGSRICQEYIDQLASVKGLAKFNVELDTNFVNVGTLRKLEELRVQESCFITDLKSLPYILLNLKRIHFALASFNEILLFVRHAEKVNKIKVEYFRDANFLVHARTLDLLVLNKEREKLVGACKITIYVREDVYLATKRAMKQMDFKLIEMKRDTSYNWIL